MYSSAIPNQRQLIGLKRAMEEQMYTCGSAAFPESHHLYDVLLVRESITCNTTVEVTYYGGIYQTLLLIAGQTIYKYIIAVPCTLLT